MPCHDWFHVGRPRSPNLDDLRPGQRHFQTTRGGVIQHSAYSAVWAEARKQALAPAQYRSSLGRRPYDLRQAAVSLWLNSGVPATEVARHAGHGVAVLLKVYAHCIDGQADAANRRMTDALGTQDTSLSQNPVTRQPTTASRHSETPGQRREAGRAVSVTAPTGPSVALSAPVRGPYPARIWGARTHSGRRLGGRTVGDTVGFPRTGTDGPSWRRVSA